MTRIFIILALFFLVLTILSFFLKFIPGLPASPAVSTSVGVNVEPYEEPAIPFVPAEATAPLPTPELTAISAPAEAVATTTPAAVMATPIPEAAIPDPQLLPEVTATVMGYSSSAPIPVQYDDTVIMIEPAWTSVEAGQPAAISVVIQTQRPLYAASFELWFDASALQVKSIEPDDFFPTANSFIYHNLDNQQGVLAWSVSSDMGVPAGSDRLATIYFSSVVAGEYWLSLANIPGATGVQPVDEPWGQVIVQSGQLLVTQPVATPTPPDATPPPPVATLAPPDATPASPRHDLVEVTWPITMPLDSSASIRLSLSQSTVEITVNTPEPGYAATGQPLSEAVKVIGTPGPINSAFGPDYQAYALAKLGSVTFDVQAVTSERQSLDQPKMTWIWNISPKSGGDHEIALSLEAEWEPNTNIQPAGSQSKKQQQLWTRQLPIRVENGPPPSQLDKFVNTATQVNGLLTILFGIFGTISEAFSKGRTFWPTKQPKSQPLALPAPPPNRLNNGSAALPDLTTAVALASSNAASLLNQAATEPNKADGDYRRAAAEARGVLAKLLSDKNFHLQARRLSGLRTQHQADFMALVSNSTAAEHFFEREAELLGPYFLPDEAGLLQTARQTLADIRAGRQPTGRSPQAVNELYTAVEQLLRRPVSAFSALKQQPNLHEIVTGLNGVVLLLVNIQAESDKVLTPEQAVLGEYIASGIIENAAAVVRS